MLTSSGLINLIKKYDPVVDEDLLRRAYFFSMEAHGMQKRDSGSPYFYHPAEVAYYLAELKLDVQTIAAGLLHDVLEDTNVSVEELEEIFGAEIAFLVQGVTKLSTISYNGKNKQAENFRKLLITMSKDIRVLIIKLADRLNNIRTVNQLILPEKTKRISLETLEIYAPLAERIGMNLIKEEIEDLSFFNLHPNEYSGISQKLSKIRNEDRNFVPNTILSLKKMLKENGVDAYITGREKRIYSIWKKMQTQNISLEQITDIVAFRVIVANVQQCYYVLGIIHTNFHIVPGKFKDYISVPKLNNYRSLHTTVIGPFNQPMEVQIRSEEMHRIADEGAAAHWSYKDGKIVTSQNENLAYSWIKSLLTIIKNSESPKELMDNTKMEMFENEVFCFTPKGDLITLPRGAIAVDFAYRIHTTVGNTCVGVKINGKTTPLKTVLRNGDQVYVITSPQQKPEIEWERFVVSGKAKACIRKFRRKLEKTEFELLGIQLVKYVFSATDICYSEDFIKISLFSCQSIKRFYFNLAKGVIPLNNIRDMIHASPFTSLHKESIYLCDFTPGIAINFAECCKPILGDKVIGILSASDGLIVHQTSCSNMDCEGNFIKVRWNKDDEHEQFSTAQLQLIIVNATSSLADVTNIISASGANITNLRIEHRSFDFFDLVIDIKAEDISHLKGLQASLRTCSCVKSVRRL
ncbi:MAG: bifunctional (p)ppGpp synthetase/guanosine-3',5'-bis(diphosphate) 3'-pyrophosphohydrolase [Holosporaceae bacterium]|nr:bifunctional (p)ppGpp synthetase/guanosine-3',5'-bis(diphosphate) 3'-pyrophosphohydrolase [Holosporaceae bacterium]